MKKNGGVKCGPYHIMLYGIIGTRSHIHEDDGSMMDEHSSEVSSTWREPFALAFGSTHLEDDKENDIIGNKDNQDIDDLSNVHIVEEAHLLYS